MTSASRRATPNDRSIGRERRSPWVGFSVLAAIEFLTVLDASVVNIALPVIRDGLGFSYTSIAWVVDAYLIGFAGFLLLAGAATDVVGRRRLFIAGTVVFTIFSIVCAVATDPWHLAVSRLLQGLGGAMVFPAALALIIDIFPEGPERRKAIGIFSGMAGLAAPVGLVLGGLLAASAWQWIFLINAPVGIAVVGFSFKLLPSAAPSRQDGIDTFGAVTVTAGLVLLILAMLRGNAQGWTSAPTQAAFVGAAILLTVFVVQQRVAPAPLISGEILRRRTTVIGNIIFALVGAILVSTFFFVSLFLQRVRGLDSMDAALIYLPVPIGMFFGTQLAPRILRFGPHNALLTGLLIQAAGLTGWATMIDAEHSLLGTFWVPATAWAFGLGISIVSSFVVCTMGLSDQVAGVASGLATTTYQGGGAVGLAALAVVADQQNRGGTGAALTEGYGAALWCCVGIALVGAALTRFAVGGSAQPSAEPADAPPRPPPRTANR